MDSRSRLGSPPQHFGRECSWQRTSGLGSPLEDEKNRRLREMQEEELNRYPVKTLLVGLHSLKPLALSSSTGASSVNSILLRHHNAPSRTSQRHRTRPDILAPTWVRPEVYISSRSTQRKKFLLLVTVVLST